jgi:hypothetical protein
LVGGTTLGHEQLGGHTFLENGGPQWHEPFEHGQLVRDLLGEGDVSLQVRRDPGRDDDQQQDRYGDRADEPVRDGPP